MTALEGSLKFEITSQKVWLDPPNAKLKSAEYAAAYVEADVRIIIQNKIIRESAQFTVFELVHALEKWKTSRGCSDFSFASFNDEHGEFIRISKTGDAFALKIKGPEDWMSVDIAKEELFEAISQFTESMLAKAENDFKNDLKKLLSS